MTLIILDIYKMAISYHSAYSMIGHRLWLVMVWSRQFLFQFIFGPDVILLETCMISKDVTEGLQSNNHRHRNVMVYKMR